MLFEHHGWIQSVEKIKKNCRKHNFIKEFSTGTSKSNWRLKYSFLFQRRLPNYFTTKKCSNFCILIIRQTDFSLKSGGIGNLLMLHRVKTRDSHKSFFKVQHRLPLYQVLVLETMEHSEWFGIGKRTKVIFWSYVWTSIVIILRNVSSTCSTKQYFYLNNLIWENFACTFFMLGTTLIAF